jgi:hypothetical protein
VDANSTIISTLLVLELVVRDRFQREQACIEDKRKMVGKVTGLIPEKREKEHKELLQITMRTLSNNTEYFNKMI